MTEGNREVSVGAEVVRTSGKSFNEIIALISAVSKQVGDISTAIQQMASGSDQIVTSVQEIGKISQDTAGQTQSVSAATQHPHPWKKSQPPVRP